VRTLCIVLSVVALADGPSPRIDRMNRWVEAVLAHRPGEFDSAITFVTGMRVPEVQTLSVDAKTLVILMRNSRATIFYINQGKRQVKIDYGLSDVDALRALARRVSPNPQNDGVKTAEINRFLRRAALLEGDVAMLNLVEQVPLSAAPKGPSFRFRVHVNDGQTISINQAPVHWELARAMLDLIAPNPARDEMVRAWYIATAAAVEDREEHDTDHLNRALELFPDDPTILFFNGCLHEGYASDRLQTAIKSMKLPTGMSIDIGSAHTELALAQGFLKKAVAEDPGFAEARLHFGHVLGSLGRHQEAAAELRQALESLDDDANRYYASMFLGKEEEALGRLDAARAAYEAARELFPGAQSPRLALSQLAWRQGDRSNAIAAARDAFTGDADPWWTYAFAHARHSNELLEELRRPFLSEPPR
jgi:tetratricopeptide (TPR) repeat protein